MVLLTALLACLTPDNKQPKTELVTGALAACQAQREPSTCYQAAVEHPERSDYDVLLGPACRAGIENACRLLHDWRLARNQLARAADSALFGCSKGDNGLCDDLRAYAGRPEFADRREFMMKVVEEAR